MGFRLATAAVGILRFVPLLILVLVHGYVEVVAALGELWPALSMDRVTGSDDGEPWDGGGDPWPSAWPAVRVAVLAAAVGTAVAAHLAAAYFWWAYGMVVGTDPGRVPWTFPLPAGDAACEEAALAAHAGDRSLCRHCDRMKPRRAHHCKICGRCVLRMDHHCPWVMNCVGAYNHKYFVQMLLALAAACALYAACMAVRGAQILHYREAYLLLALQVAAVALLCGVLAPAMLGFAFMHLRQAMSNRTGVDSLVPLRVVDAAGRDRGDLYDLGSVLANLREDFGSSKLRWLLPLPSLDVDPAYPSMNPALLESGARLAEL